MFGYAVTIVVKKRDRCGVPKRFLLSSSFVLSLQYVIDSVFLNRIELLFLQQFWSVYAVGYYAVSLSIANLALQLPIQLTGSLLPYYSQRRHSDEGGAISTEVFAGVIRALSYVTLPMSFGLAAVSTPLVVAVFGESFRPAGPIVALLALSAPAFVLMMTLSQYLLSIDLAKKRLYTALTGSAVIVGGCFIAVPHFGGEGAAVARLAGFTVMCLIMIRATGFGRALAPLYTALLKVAAASIVVAGTAVLIEQFVTGVPGIILAIVAGVAIYPVALRALRGLPDEDGLVMLNIANALPRKIAGPARRAVLFLVPGMVAVQAQT